MLNETETELMSLIRHSMLPGQEGIKIRAFLAFNRESNLANIENIHNLQSKDAILIKEDTIYPVETL